MKLISKQKCEIGVFVPRKKIVNVNCQNIITVKFVCNDHPWDPKTVAAVVRWLLFRGHLYSKSSERDFEMVVVVGRRSIFRGGR